MKNLTILIAISLFLAACGGGSGNSGNLTTAAKNTNTATPSPVKTAEPLPTTFEEVDLRDSKFDSIESLENLKGKGIIIKGEIITYWTTEAITFSFSNDFITCNGNFGEYKDAIKAFSDGKIKGYVHADVKGVVDSVKKSDTSATLMTTLKNCILTHLEK